MSLAIVSVATTDFDLIHQHLMTHKPPYQNMHLRQARIRSKKRVLRYLHAMYASSGQRREIEGIVSGPEIFCHYKLIRTGTRTQLNVLAEQGLPAELTRIQAQFLKEILERVRVEKVDNVYFPSRLPGQYYLRRSRHGSPVSHRHCQRAVATHTLAPAFVSNLVAWDLELLCP